MDTGGIVTIVLFVFLLISWYFIFRLIGDVRILKYSNSLLDRWCDEYREEKDKYFDAAEKLRVSNNRYKSRLHRRDVRIKNLLIKIENKGLSKNNTKKKGLQK